MDTLGNLHRIFIPPAPIVGALKPYIESHSIDRVWIAVVGIAGVIEVAGAFRRREEATKKDRGSSIVIRVCAIPGVALLLLAPRIAPAGEIHPPVVSAVVGITIFSAGEALRVWSKVALGRYFTYTVMTSGDQPVITTGPYRFVRHPSYAGILLMAIGAGATWGNWLGLFGLAASVLVGLIYRINVEERALLEELGDRYRAYAERHKRLIPFVW